MALLDLTKKPHLEDVAEALNAVEARLVLVETRTAIHEARLQTLEEFMTQHKAGAQARQHEIDRLTTENTKLQWQLRTGGR